VNAWQDARASGPRTVKPAPQIGRDEINLVSNLVDGENGTWKIDLIQRNFITPCADDILIS
jgi:hypothetical protein